MVRASKWYLHHRVLLEAFVLVNLLFLGPDIYLAHSTNSFRHWAERIPLYFSLAAPATLNAIKDRASARANGRVISCLQATKDFGGRRQNKLIVR